MFTGPGMLLWHYLQQHYDVLLIGAAIVVYFGVVMVREHRSVTCVCDNCGLEFKYNKHHHQYRNAQGEWLFIFCTYCMTHVVDM
jgi:hypothetical protein